VPESRKQIENDHFTHTKSKRRRNKLLIYFIVSTLLITLFVAYVFIRATDVNDMHTNSTFSTLFRRILDLFRFSPLSINWFVITDDIIRYFNSSLDAISKKSIDLGGLVTASTLINTIITASYTVIFNMYQKRKNGFVIANLPSSQDVILTSKIARIAAIIGLFISIYAYSFNADLLTITSCTISFCCSFFLILFSIHDPFDDKQILDRYDHDFINNRVIWMENIDDFVRLEIISSNRTGHIGLKKIDVFLDLLFRAYRKSGVNLSKLNGNDEEADIADTVKTILDPIYRLYTLAIRECDFLCEILQRLDTYLVTNKNLHAEFVLIIDMFTYYYLSKCSEKHQIKSALKFYLFTQHITDDQANQIPIIKARVMCCLAYNDTRQELVPKTQTEKLIVNIIEKYPIPS